MFHRALTCRNILGRLVRKQLGESYAMLFRPAVPVLLLTIILTATGQVETSTSIRGLVTDPAGATVAGASVTIRSATTAEERTTVTDANGLYSLPSIAPGTYTVI